MKKELYVCWQDKNDDGIIDGYELMLLAPESDIMNPDNLIAAYPVQMSSAGTPLIPAAMIHKLAELQNLGYPIRFFF